MKTLYIPGLEQYQAPDIVGKPVAEVGLAALISVAISLKRIADAAEKISECADGIHPSAFRTSTQS